MLVRKAAKITALPLGMRGCRPGDLAVLLYHRVGSGSREIDLPESAFSSQLAALREDRGVLSIDRAIGTGSGGVVVTFDDGYRDFHERALPLLVRHGIPAVLYLATGLVDGTLPADNGDRLGWSHLQEAIDTRLVTVGAHTHSHADLSRATEREAEEEMRRSKELVEDRLGVPCRHFAYPWGVASPSAERAAGRLFDTAALGWGTNRRGRTNLLQLHRTPVLRSDGPWFFRAKVKGRLDGEAWMYRALRRGPWRRT
jgi:peptidoglycan/xylan/chitin deacetylase (PgdA/CDA1 family)